MSVVIDASLTMTWCFPDEASNEADEMLDLVANEGAIVPDLWRLEVVNVLLVAERRHRLTEAQASHFLELLHGLPIEVDSMPTNAASVLAAGRHHRLSAYDATYLALAERLGLALLTRDEALRSAGRRAGVTVLP